ncbi:RHS repeat-associated core domain-containing protein [Shewanella baltica]|uniref:RHS repeat-associated core domain-containing protein n=1 Tax=Shewanella baltica TaxID=62322 RepID=UPI000DFF6898|nr:RHS repeat-associated core domain-containing protein [Shewanella baltica]SUI78372.1 Cell wall-associated polypeptide CWBP200 [Shewanella baltica]
MDIRTISMKFMMRLILLATALIALSSSAATVRYQHTDMLGSVIAESDSAGNIISRSHYEPFGKRMGGDKEGIGYTGHLQDKDLGLTYMQARYYDPLIGRFYSNDPIGFRDVHSFNRYAYGNNNPYKYTDPDGQNPIDAFVKEGETIANMFGFDSASQATEQGQSAIDSTGNVAEAVSNEIGSRMSVSASGSAGLGLGATISAEVDSQTLQGEGVKLDGGLTGPAYGASAGVTGNLTIVKPDSNAKGLITSTTAMAGNGLGGGVTIQWTPSIGVTIHAGPVAGVSVESKVAGVETRILEN